MVDDCKEIIVPSRHSRTATHMKSQWLWQHTYSLWASSQTKSQYGQGSCKWSPTFHWGDISNWHLLGKGASVSLKWCHWQVNHVLVEDRTVMNIWAAQIGLDGWKKDYTVVGIRKVLLLSWSVLCFSPSIFVVWGFTFLIHTELIFFNTYICRDIQFSIYHLLASLLFLQCHFLGSLLKTSWL